MTKRSLKRKKAGSSREKTLHNPKKPNENNLQLMRTKPWAKPSYSSNLNSASFSVRLFYLPYGVNID